MRARLALVAAVAALGGCSLATVQKPNPVKPGQSPGPCTSSPTAPYLDGALTLAGVVGTGFGTMYWLEQDEDGGDPADAVLPAVAIVVPILITVTAGASSIWGFKQTSRCRELLRAAGDASVPLVVP